jgi:AcrR family transcriptional regulator
MPRRAKTVPRRAPRQKRAEDTVDVLVRATELAFTRHGFTGATTNRIAALAGVSIGTLYHYFPTKEALVQAVVHRMWQEELEALASRIGVFDERPLDEALRELVGALCGLIARRRALVARWYTEAAHLGDLGAGLGMANQAIALIEAALARKRELLRPRDLHFAADLVVKTALAVARTGSRDYPDQLANGELAEELTQMLSRYLLRDPPP